MKKKLIIIQPQIKIISENFVKNQVLLSQIEKLLKNNSLKNDSSFTINEELKIVLEGIQKNIILYLKKFNPLKLRLINLMILKLLKMIIQIFK